MHTNTIILCSIDVFYYDKTANYHEKESKAKETVKV